MIAALPGLLARQEVWAPDPLVRTLPRPAPPCRLKQHVREQELSAVELLKQFRLENAKEISKLRQDFGLQASGWRGLLCFLSVREISQLRRDLGCRRVWSVGRSSEGLWPVLGAGLCGVLGS